MIGYCSSGGCGWEEAAQVLSDDITQLLLEVRYLCLGQAHYYRETLKTHHTWLIDCTEDLNRIINTHNLQREPEQTHTHYSKNTSIINIHRPAGTVAMCPE